MTTFVKPSLAMGVVGGHIVNFLCVEPSLGIRDIGIVCKKVDTNGDNLGTGDETDLRAMLVTIA